jgi:hypothetical protein
MSIYFKHFILGMGLVYWSAFAEAPNYLTAGPVTATDVTASGTAQISVPIKVLNGFHVQANPASGPGLKPTKLEMSPESGVTFGRPLYPKGRSYQMLGSANSIQVYEERFDIKLPVSVAAASAGGLRQLKGKISYQACNEKNCFFPSSVDITIPLNVKPK